VLNKNNFEIAKLLSDADDAQSVHRSLRVEPKATVATDGRLLVKVTAPEVAATLFTPIEGIDAAEWFTPFLIDRETALKIGKAIPKNGLPNTQFAAVDCSTEINGKATIAVNELVRQDVITSEKVDGNYPDYERFLPDPDKAKMLVSFDPELLAQLMTVVQAFCKAQGAQQIVLRIYGAQQGMRIDAAGNGQQMTAVIMPMRFTESE
jgi:hypothetical protein